MGTATRFAVAGAGAAEREEDDDVAGGGEVNLADEDELELPPPR